MINNKTMNVKMNDILKRLISKYGSAVQDGENCVIIDVDENDLCSEDIPQYIANLTDYKNRVKEIHWSADNDKVHILSDDLYYHIDRLQDYIAEDYMGLTGKKFSIGFLKTSCECESDNFVDIVNELKKDTIEMYNVTSKDLSLKGIEHFLNEFIDFLNTLLYKETQK